MNKLRLNQLNKQKVAEREMNAINGGTSTDGSNNPTANGIDPVEIPWKCFFGSRAWEEYYSAEACGNGYNNGYTFYYY